MMERRTLSGGSASSRGSGDTSDPSSDGALPAKVVSSETQVQYVAAMQDLQDELAKQQAPRPRTVSEVDALFKMLSPVPDGESTGSVRADGKIRTLFRCPFKGNISAAGGGSKPCTKVCPRKADLKRHYRTHFDVRPYKCRADAACRESFKDTSNRCKHERTHTTQCFNCPVCQRTFTRQDNMKTHQKKIHGDL